MFDSGTLKTMLNMKFYDKYPILHQYPKYPINTQPIQVAKDHLMSVKKVIISFPLEIIPCVIIPYV